MSIFTWQPFYSTQITTMDKQHQVLIKWMNQFHTAQSKGNEAEAKKALNELLRFTKLHFEDEENMMQKFEFPEFQSHKEHHDRILSIVSDSANNYMNNPTKENGMALINFLKNWLSGHILGMDKKYCSLKDKGAH